METESETVKRDRSEKSDTSVRSEQLCVLLSVGFLCFWFTTAGPDPGQPGLTAGFTPPLCNYVTFTTRLT